MAKVVAPDGLDREAVAELEKAFGTVSVKPTDLFGEMRDALVLIVRSKTKVNDGLLTFGPKLKVVARAGVGLDNVDIEACKRKGITVFNTPDASTVAVAEFTVAMILSLNRHIPRADACLRISKWEKDSTVGRELYGKTVGVIGFGRIGSAVAERLRVFGCKIITFSLEFIKDPGETEVVTLNELLKRADVVTLHVPLTPETKNMINAERLALMKPTAILVNTARGELVDERALYEALKDKKLAGAAIDVYPKEPYEGMLCRLENAVLTPHIAGSTHEGQARIGKQIVDTLKKMKEKGEV